MIHYLDLTKLFIRSLKINKYNKKDGKLFFYTLVFLTIIFVFLPLLFIFTIFIYDTMRQLNDVDFATTGFEALLFLVFIFSFIFSFNALINELYFSEDIESILPLPVKPEIIVASKFTSCYIVENLILLIFLILAVLSYLCALQLPIINFAISFLGILFLPMIPMVLCTIVILLTISLLKKFMNGKDIKKIGFALLGILIIGIAYLLWKISSINFEEYMEKFASGDHTFIEVMKIMIPSVHFFVIGLEQGSIIHILLSIIISIIYFFIMIIIAKYLYYNSVIDINSKDTDSKKHSHYQIKTFQVEKPIIQYLKKDLKLLFRSPTFFINCMMINIIWPIFIFLIFKIALPSYTISYMRNVINLQNSVFDSRLIIMIIGISIMVPTFNSLASSAFSREGKNYHFIKYIPMKYGLQWREKYFISLLISLLGISIYMIPFLIMITCPIYKIILYLTITILCISIVSFIGLLIDSAFPKLIWDDETDSLRENYNAFIAMGYSLLLFTIICGGGYYLLDHHYLNISQYILITLLILIVGNLILYWISNHKISQNIINQEVF